MEGNINRKRNRDFKKQYEVHNGKKRTNKKQQKQQIKRSLASVAIGAGAMAVAMGTYQKQGEKPVAKQSVLLEDTLEDIEVMDVVDITVEDEIKDLKNEQDVTNYINNFYIEEYEKETGDQTLTTKDINIKETNQNYIYMNNETGEYITHGKTPAVTEQKLSEIGVNYSSIPDVNILKVEKAQGENVEVIDCGALVNGKLEKVIPAEQLNSNKEYPSILTNKEIAQVILKGLELKKMISNDRTEYVKKMIASLKKELIEAIKQNQKATDVQTKTAQIEDDEMER